ncbi:hypothetical protein ACFQPA_01635 [Halomarina halobia]|uniref:Uncharacterized protein n=1 Tax=Halomarina halobia TaxID=3033386 RepID=A0ABD6A6L9_9EURY|nr:hypothetical protein [Halomarina sp. PSR21]
MAGRLSFVRASALYGPVMGVRTLHPASGATDAEVRRAVEGVGAGPRAGPR